MKQSLHTLMINLVLQDPKDRSFVAAIRKFMDLLPESYFIEDADLQETKKFLIRMSEEGIFNKEEMLYHLSTVPYSTNFKMTIDDTCSYSDSYKRHFLSNLSAELMVHNIKPTVDSILHYMNQIEYDYSSKEGAEAVDKLLQTIQSLQENSNKINLNIGKSNALVIDPNATDIDRSILDTVNDLQVQVNNRIKIIPAVNSLLGGGLAPATLTLFAAITGRGKSLIMHNIALYAGKNNNREDLDAENPCIVFISLELTRVQLFRRHLSWCGLQKSEAEISQMSEEEIGELIIRVSREAGLKIPIIYIERQTDHDRTNVNDIANELDKYINQGYDPILAVIDYTDRLDVASMKHNSMGISGADGSQVLKQKCKECRKLAIDYNIPVLSAAQLSGQAISMMSECEPYYKYIDILYNFKDDWLSGSKILQQEVENMIFCHTFDISENIITESGHDQTIIRKWLSLHVTKDRDNTSRYVRSRRDDVYESAYLAHLNSSRIGKPYSYLLKTDARPHVVLPMAYFKMLEDDYARSITMFYPDENAGKVQEYNQQAEEISIQDKVNDLFDE